MNKELPRNRKPAHVPSGMVGGCPWGTPLDRWSSNQLLRGRDHLSKSGDSPRLLDAINRELRNHAAK